MIDIVGHWAGFDYDCWSQKMFDSGSHLGFAEAPLKVFALTKINNWFHGCLNGNEGN